MAASRRAFSSGRRAAMRNISRQAKRGAIAYQYPVPEQQPAEGAPGADVHQEKVDRRGQVAANPGRSVRHQLRFGLAQRNAETAASESSSSQRDYPGRLCQGVHIPCRTYLTQCGGSPPPGPLQ